MRIGPDYPYDKVKMRENLYKFKHFAKTAELRPQAYIIGCENISIGERVTIRPMTVLNATKGEIIIEDDVGIGMGVHIYVCNHRYEAPPVVERKDNNGNAIYPPIIHQGSLQGTTITLKRGCWIGANAIILPGVTIGNNAVVGAGSVVTKSIPSREVWGGNPAKRIK